jgi:hypothetical protein
MPQHSEFLNGTYNFPAKPRNQWEIGAKFGAFTVAGDVPALFPTLGLGCMQERHLDMYFLCELNTCMEPEKVFIGRLQLIT